ncbi:PepSY domain-containing protein [Chelatococcus reniformis]|uniref:PepSY domain-containing protein n=1 Tax=Chelatococcus reniformis TaxID=1494448 RepID=A0A916UZZ0_9HYPH|nr:PepSY domain-containing protein [Chelatococcus reniformis]GGC93752.1 hypothetical protein GCM10010994_59430 [Chelatococcus reniformis]
MKMMILSICAIGLASSALSQTAPAQNPNAPSNPAVSAKEGNNPGAPAPGANSFTEAQAKSRIEAKGYNEVMSLKKGDDGIWRGAASKDGKTHQVALDYQGNVVAK